LPPAKDPDVGYAVTFGENYQIENLVPGGSYPIDSATVESARIRLSVNPNEVERSWCAMQTSYPVHTYAVDEPNGYACWPEGLTQSNVDGSCAFSNANLSVVVSCTRISLCYSGGPCSCDAQGCTISDPPPEKQGSFTRFDATLVDGGSTLVGTIKLGPEDSRSSATVRLKRL